MKSFEEVKEIMLERARNAGACVAGYRMGKEATNKAGLLRAVTAYFSWVFREGVVDAEFLNEHFTPEELLQAGIYTIGYAEVNTISFACGSATVKAHGSATVKAYGSATVEAHGSATVKAYGSATVKAYDSAYLLDYTEAHTEPKDNAIIRHRYSGKVFVKKNAFEIVQVE